MCKHNWQHILPSSNSAEIEESKRLDYFVDVAVLGRFSDIFYCDKCGFTGHTIKSYRGGVRRHTSPGNYFFTKANEIRLKYGLPELKQATE